MTPLEVNRLLDEPAEGERFLRTCGVANVERGLGNLQRVASVMPIELFGVVCETLMRHLLDLSDPDMALNNLDRFLSAAPDAAAIVREFDRDPQALPILLSIFSTSQHLSDLLFIDSEGFELLRRTEGQPLQREALVDEIMAQVAPLSGDDLAASNALRRFKRRETLRICYGDIIRSQRLDIVTRQISHLADAIVEAAVLAARQKLAKKRREPSTAAVQRTRFVVLALGKLGGAELNYSSDIDLMFLHDAGPDATAAQAQAAAEYFDRLARLVVKLLAEPTEMGAAYRVDLRLRPSGQSGPITNSLEGALHYYDVSGRTWERQAFVKARPIAGDHDLGGEFLARLEPWIYRRYLSRADITGIKALKRRIEQRTHREGAHAHNVKTGHGGIRDIEFVIQFLQLLNGGDLPALRTGNTLEAIAQLDACGCLTRQERSLLEENYSFLRKIEHRLQIMFDLQTHLLPTDPTELRKVALRMGYRDGIASDALAQFAADYRQKTELNRKILDHLLHDAFSDDAAADPETDLVLDPEPGPERIRDILGRRRFQDIPRAYENLMELSSEKIRFLSTRRCRHFLASIAPSLLRAIAATPDPDFTLLNLSTVSDSLGGKGVLWELFSFNPPTLRLYVELCSSSQYLSGILTSNPGMLDELLDGLLLDRLPTIAGLTAELNELCRGAENLDPILQSFKNAQQLRVGVRDILGKEQIEAITGALSDIAEVLLRQIVDVEHAKLVEKMGRPTVAAADGVERPCEPIIVAMGKFGGRELNYYSDLDLVFLYEQDGSTLRSRRNKHETVTTNQHFFSELGARIIKAASQLGPYGKLYHIDARLRPTGKSGILATSLPEFARYFSSGQGQLWERQSLCEARVVYGSPADRGKAIAAIHQAAFAPACQPNDVAQIRQMRKRLEVNVGPGNIKRGPGGLVDIEFLVQMLQLAHGGQDERTRAPGALSALKALYEAGALAQEDYEYFSDSFRFLRTIQARLRLMSPTARDSLPEDPHELAKLAGLLKYSAPEDLLSDVAYYTSENRRRFETLIGARANAT